MNREILIVVAVSVGLMVGYELVKRYLLRRGLWPKELQRIREKTRRYVTGMLERCPACSSALTGHLICGPIFIPRPSKDHGVVADLLDPTREGSLRVVRGRRGNVRPQAGLSKVTPHIQPLGRYAPQATSATSSRTQAEARAPALSVR
jgi:hypothetical protein